LYFFCQLVGDRLFFVCIGGDLNGFQAGGSKNAMTLGAMAISFHPLRLVF
jgi:hypothetical protein